MTLSIRSLIIGSVALAFVAAAFIGAPAARADHWWGAYKWGKAVPFTLELGDNLSSQWDAYLAEAVADWNPSVVLDTVIKPGNTNATKGRNTPKNCTPTSGRVEACNAKYGSTGWLGIASIWTSGSTIVAGTVKMNDTYYNTSSYNTPDWRGMVMCQEIAHTFGLDHQDEAFGNANLGTCMDYTNAPGGGIVGGFNYGITNRYPNFHDFEQLEIMYGYVAPALVQLSESAAAADSNDPKAWGREVRRSADGRASVFEQDLGKGNKIIRHVFWVEPRGDHHD